jgi:hypothetical protein
MSGFVFFDCDAPIPLLSNCSVTTGIELNTALIHVENSIRSYLTTFRVKWLQEFILPGI